MSQGIDFKDKFDQWGPTDARILYVSFWTRVVGKFNVGSSEVLFPRALSIFNHDRLTLYWSKLNMLKHGRAAIEKWILPKSKRLLLWREYKRRLKSIQNIAQRIEQTTRHETKVGHIKNLAIHWCEQLTRVWQAAIIPEVANYVAPFYLEERIKECVPRDRVAHILEILLTPERLSFHQRAELEALRIFAVSKTKKDLLGQMQEYAEKWDWLENSYYESQRLDYSYFLNQLEGLSKKRASQKIKRIERYINEVKLNKRLVARKYHLPREVLETARSLAFSIWWQDHRKAVVWWAGSVLDKLSTVVQLEHNLSYDEIMHYTVEEWLRLIVSKKRVPKGVIKKRKGLAILEMRNQKYYFHYGQQARKIRDYLELTKTVTTASELAGIIVSGGKRHRVKGIARILFSPRKSSNFLTGEILVAPMTSPDYIVAMRKAKAIITDVGGLMSHAAIVSRELGIPCIVGTKVATKVFKDGDLVEVDANKGVVRKL